MAKGRVDADSFDLSISPVVDQSGDSQPANPGISQRLRLDLDTIGRVVSPRSSMTLQPAHDFCQRSWLILMADARSDDQWVSSTSGGERVFHEAPMRGNHTVLVSRGQDAIRGQGQVRCGLSSHSRLLRVGAISVAVVAYERVPEIGERASIAWGVIKAPELLLIPGLI
jgi:hypothetical protein